MQDSIGAAYQSSTNLRRRPRALSHCFEIRAWPLTSFLAGADFLPAAGAAVSLQDFFA